MKATVSDAIGLSLTDLGVDIVTHVPGFGAFETFQSYNIIGRKQSASSFHEEVAYTIAHGASITGKRSASLMKAHGFVKAANSIVDSLYTNLTAGFVTIIFDDKVGSYSDNILKIEPILNGMHFPYKIGKASTIYDDVVDCFLISEKHNMPYALLVDAAEINKETSFDSKPQAKNFNYERDILHHVVHPLLADYQFKNMMSKVMPDTPPVITIPDLPNIPDQLPERLKEAVNTYVPFFNTFQNIRGDIVTGDTSVSSSFAFPPYNAIDIITYMGGSIPLAIGAYLAGKRDVWAVTGDFGFISAGQLGLLEAVEREIPLKILIFYNKQAAATGGQKIHKKIMIRLLAGYDNFIRHISNPNDPFEVDEVLSEVAKEDELRIVLIDY